MSSESCFKISQLDNVTILTLLVESVSASNAHWVKEQILNYLAEERPFGLIINLNNVYYIDSLGIGVLISINSRSKRFDRFALMGIQPEIEERIFA